MKPCGSRDVAFIIIKCVFYCSFLPEGLMTCNSTKTACKLAIIGSGVGGTSCAYFLKELLPGVNVSIDVYEANKIGGRLSSVEVNGTCFEAGGSAIHSRNRYMADFAKTFRLGTRPLTSTGLTGLHDGHQFTFVEGESSSVTYAKLLWNYGTDLVRLRRYVGALLDRFDNVYRDQERKRSFGDVSGLLHAMHPDMPGYLTRSIDSFLVEEDYNKRVIEEVVYATVHVNYGQNGTVHQFVGSVAVVGGVDELWSINGCNCRVPEKLLERSEANLINKRVDAIELMETKFALKSSGDVMEYDVIVVAAPLTNDAKLPIKFHNFPNDMTVKGSYHRTVCTFVVGTLNKTFFDDHDPLDVPDSVIPINERFFNSITLMKQDGTVSVYKIFSQTVLTGPQLDSLFKDIYDVKVFDWLAYPEYGTEPRNDSFVLHRNLYYVNAIEWAASAMEMSVIGAKNVALLIRDGLNVTENTVNRSPDHMLSCMLLLFSVCYWLLE